jgi:arylsulfatase A-like enzyme
VWLRREEFINEHTMDRYVHDDRGVWADWDRKALDGMVQLTRTSNKPIFAIVLLMSSHFEYQFPPAYAIDQPTESRVWHEGMATAMGPEAELPLRNRYRNTMRFLDDLIGDAIGRLDPQGNLVILTGDHGESIYDDGHYTHGYSFAEIITRTPLAMVGPGVAPARIDSPTLHMDVLPTVLHALTGERQFIDGVQGIDWLANERHGAVLESRWPFTRHILETQLRAAGRHLRLDLDLTRPSIMLLGFEDQLGHLQPTPALSEREVTEIAGGFEWQLSMLRR